MRTVPGLRKTKIVVVTDRTQLQKQLGETMALAGETGRRREKDQPGHGSCCRRHGPGLVFVMIQKQQDARPGAQAATADDIIEGSSALPRPS